MPSAAFVVRGPQIQAMEAEYRKHIIHTVAWNLRISAPHAIAGLSPAEVELRLQAALHGAIRYNLTDPADIEAFARLCFVIGPYFDRYEKFRRAFAAATQPGSNFSMIEVLMVATPEDWCRAAQADILLRSQEQSHTSAERIPIRLETLAPHHAEAWFQGVSHPDVWRLGGLQPPASAKDVRDWIEGTRTHPQPGNYRFALITKQTGTFAGAARIWKSQDEDCVYMSYWVVRDQWSKGIATQAVRQLLVYLGPGITQPVRLKIDSGNLPSLRVAEKCGFEAISTESGITLLERRHHG
ncbi:hypothetical protein F183_A08390 [Bryobacterales bacterium F-183]|nr:hypothetical protein F183_A08390 [Bryobacterales bacterium F-183]